MNEILEKTIDRTLYLVSILALTYYAASSIYHIVESDNQIYSYDSQITANWSTAKLETNRSGK
ncbi:MAG: hypothetical protein ACRC62_31610 [Microcoleus sp.]